MSGKDCKGKWGKRKRREKKNREESIKELEEVKKEVLEQTHHLSFTRLEFAILLLQYDFLVLVFLDYK